MNFTIRVAHRVKLKESKKRNKYKDLARELKKKRNKKMKLIPIVIGSGRTTPKSLINGQEDLQIRGHLETIHTTALLREAIILRRVLETGKDLLSLKLERENVT